MWAWCAFQFLFFVFLGLCVLLDALRPRWKPKRFE